MGRELGTPGHRIQPRCRGSHSFLLPPPAWSRSSGGLNSLAGPRMRNAAELATVLKGRQDWFGAPTAFAHERRTAFGASGRLKCELHLHYDSSGPARACDHVTSCDFVRAPSWANLHGRSVAADGLLDLPHRVPPPDLAISAARIGRCSTWAARVSIASVGPRQRTGVVVGYHRLGLGRRIRCVGQVTSPLPPSLWSFPSLSGGLVSDRSA